MPTTTNLMLRVRAPAKAALKRPARRAAQATLFATPEAIAAQKRFLEQADSMRDHFDGDEEAFVEARAVLKAEIMQSH